MKELAGKNIVITRPGAESQHLAELVRERGGNPVLFPALEILPIEDRAALTQLFSRLNQFDLAIFISANAVKHSLPYLQGAWPAHVRCAAPGAGTVRALNAFGIKQVIVPIGGADSEHLLETPELQNAAGKRVVIFRGQKGREFLAETLAARGAAVEYAEVYRRAVPSINSSSLDEMWSKDQLHAITITSSQGLNNLFEMLGATRQRRLQQTPLFVAHARIAAAARELGCVQIVTTGAGDEGLIAGLVDWFGTRI